MQFPDGQLPSKELIKKWLGIVDEFFSPNGATKESTNLGSSDILKKGNTDGATEGGMSIEKRNNGAHPGEQSEKNEEIRRIGVHCLAGLGRAPFFVAIALVNNGCSP